MPFTFSHPAIVLPLAKIPDRWISLSGLVAGSVAPDFEYFLRLSPKSYYSHTWAGVCWYDLILSLILVFVFHLVARNPLIDNLPLFLKKRLSAFMEFNWQEYFKRNFAVVCISILIGAASHLLWDDFTHKEGFFVRHIDVLSRSFYIAGYTIPVYDFLQHFSTFAGGAAILYAILRLPAAKADKLSASFISYWLIVVAVTVIIPAGRALAGIKKEFYTNLIIASVSGALAGILIASMIYRSSKK